jgi:potassium-transporting ATPase KdpC subunit
MLQQLAPALRMSVLLTILTGLIHPGVVTGVCQLFFNSKANGSLIVRDGQVIGSTLIGQSFTRPEYFHSRPSAAGNAESGARPKNVARTLVCEGSPIIKVWQR